MPDTPPPPVGEPVDLPPPASRDPRPWPPPGGASEPVAAGATAQLEQGAPPGVVYEGEFGKPAADGALAALLCGIVGIAFCGLFTGIPAVVLGKKARSTIAEEPLRYSGGAMALAGMILGWIAIVRDLALLVVTIAVATTTDLSPFYDNLPFVS